MGMGHPECIGKSDLFFSSLQLSSLDETVLMIVKNAYLSCYRLAVRSNHPGLVPWPLLSTRHFPC